MEFNTPIKSLPEAKRYFQAMGCSSFHMAREYPERYDEYQALGISKATETEWASEEVLSKIGQIENGEKTSDELWVIHSRLADLILDHKFELYLDRLLEVTKSLETRLSQRDKLIVAETIVGRQDLRYRPGLIFRSRDSGRLATAKGFAHVARRLAAAPFTTMDLEHRRQRLLETLAQTENLCGIHLD
jgi:hypothetical protein